MGYIPNSSARNLKLQSIKEIGVVLTDIDDAFYAEILKGISLKCQEWGYIVNVTFSYFGIIGYARAGQPIKKDIGL